MQHCLRAYIFCAIHYNNAVKQRTLLPDDTFLNTKGFQEKIKSAVQIVARWEVLLLSLLLKAQVFVHLNEIL